MITSSYQSAWQHDYQEKQQEIERQKRAYFDADDVLYCRSIPAIMVHNFTNKMMHFSTIISSFVVII